MKAKLEKFDQRRLFTQIYDKYRGLLLRFIVVRIADKSQALDLTHNVFLRFLRIMEKTEWRLEVEHVGAYLFRIADRLLIDRAKVARKEGRMMSFDDLQNISLQEELEVKSVQADDSVTKIEDRLCYRELYHALPLKTILGRLSQEDRRLLYLHIVEEMSAAEIAPLLDLEVGIIRYRINRLKATIRARARSLYKEPGSKPQL